MENKKVIRLTESQLKNVISNTLTKVNKKSINEEEVLNEDMYTWIVGLTAAIPGFMLLSKIVLEFMNGVKDDTNLTPDEKKSKLKILNDKLSGIGQEIRDNKV